MVDSIGTGPVTSGDRQVAPVTRVSQTSAVKHVETTPTTNEQPQTLAGQLAAKPPVDSDRVQLIKEALANGTFPISPATLADRMIALRYDWMSRDQA